MKKIFYVILFLLYSNNILAADEISESVSILISDFLGFFLSPIVEFLAFLFLGAPYEIFGGVRTITIFQFPFIVFWLVVGGIFFTFKLRFINLRLFGHAIQVVRGKYSEDSKNAPGKISHLQALFAAVSATVGLGNIAGVAIAVSIGGPGAVVWMMIAAFFGMSTKFAEVTLGQKYRKFDKNGHLLAGSFYYLEDGLSKRGMRKFGKHLAKLSAFCCVAGAMGAGLMFQANQSVAIITESFNFSTFYKLVLVFALTFVIGFILLGGIKRIATIAEKIVPVMAITYVICCLVVLVAHFDRVDDAIRIMFTAAFSGDAIYGGVIGAIIQGVKRAAFSNEAGLGSAPIAHAAAKTTEPVREGAVAILEPFLDTIIICFMTGIVIVITGVYENSGLNDGVLLTKQAFSSVHAWFPYILSIVVFLFAFSTMLTYSYYGQQAWGYITKSVDFRLCHIVFAICVFMGGVLNIGIVIDFADILFLSMAIPNMIGLYAMSGEIKEAAEAYILKLKSGEFDKQVKKKKA